MEEVSGLLIPIGRYHPGRGPADQNFDGGGGEARPMAGRKGAKAERSKELAELRELEALSLVFGFVSGPRWRGRKPRNGHDAPLRDCHCTHPDWM